jgi:hypothetical protein
MWLARQKGRLKDPELAAAIQHAASKNRNLLPLRLLGSGNELWRYLPTVRYGIEQTARNAKEVWNQKSDLRLTGPLDPASPNRTGLGALYVASGFGSLTNEGIHYNIVLKGAELKDDSEHLHRAYSGLTIWVLRTDKPLALADFRSDNADFRRYCEAIQSDNKVNSLWKQRGRGNSDLAEAVTDEQDYTVTHGLARDEFTHPEVKGISIQGAHSYIKYIATGDYNVALSPANPTSPGSVIHHITAIAKFDIVDHPTLPESKLVRCLKLDASERPIAGFEQTGTMYAPVSLQKEKVVTECDFSEEGAGKEGT